jgi:hypothetical protein
MHTRIRKLMFTMAILCAGTFCGFYDGCSGAIQRELEVLAEPESNASLIPQSTLVDLFGPNVIKFFQDWW